MQHVNLMDEKGDRISIFAHYPSHEFEVDVESIRPAAAAADIISVTIMDYCRQYLPMLDELGAPVWIDIHDWDGANPYHQEFIEAADFLFMSSPLLPDWREFLESRIEAGAHACVATHGAAGASGITATEGWKEVKAVPAIDIVDTNGAGDAFFAGFSKAWTEGAVLGEAMEAGANQAARAVASLGLAPMVGK